MANIILMIVMIVGFIAWVIGILTWDGKCHCNEEDCKDCPFPCQERKENGYESE